MVKELPSQAPSEGIFPEGEIELEAQSGHKMAAGAGDAKGSVLAWSSPGDCFKRWKGRRMQRLPDEQAELLRALWPFLLTSRAFGVFPLTRSGASLSFFWRRPLVGYTVLVLLNTVLVFSSMVRICVEGIGAPVKTVGIGHFSPQDIVERVLNILFYLNLVLVISIVLWKAKHMPALVEFSLMVERKVLKYKGGQDSAVIMCWLITLACMLLSSATFCIQVAARAVQLNATSFSAYMHNVTDSYYKFPEALQSDWVGVYLIVLEAYSEIVWVFPDLLVLITALILARFYRRLNAHLETTLRASPLSLGELEDLRQRHLMITQLVQKSDTLLSPLTLLAYSGNVMYIFGRLYLGLTKDLNSREALIVCDNVVGFVYVAARVLISSLCAASVNEEAHKTALLLNNVPSLLPSQDSEQSPTRLLVINRFLHQLSSHTIGLTGCGYFVITKSFIMGLVSVLLTYEVIILQFSNTSLCSK